METVIITLFCSILLQKEWNISFRIKTLLKKSIAKEIKLLDCFPCFSFWLSIPVILITHGQPIDAMAVFVTASIINKLWN